jgi:NAD+ synthase (glutamine-hydrolysing)
MDFSGNFERIHESISKCRSNGSRYRIGPELELCGYGCEDHFFEMDTIIHSWESLVRLIEVGDSDNLLLDVGLPVMHKGARYNARVYCLNRKIILIRPKTVLADDGNYREGRWFTPWTWGRALDEFMLPSFVVQKLAQRSCPFGVAILQLNDTSIACEMCEELWAPRSPHIDFALNGVDIISNSSGSHHQLRKLCVRVELIRAASHKCGGVYLYSNQFGCDGGRLYFDGSPLIVVNGDCVAQGEQFGIHDVQVRPLLQFTACFSCMLQVLTAAVDLDAVRSRRMSQCSLGMQSASAFSIPTINVNFSLVESFHLSPTPPTPIFFERPEDEIGKGPACWLWDYLRRSGGSGFFLPLSGGADSAATAAIVGKMCQMVFELISQGHSGVLEDIRKITKDASFVPSSHQDIANRIFYTCYMGTSSSGDSTRSKAERLAHEIGAYHSYMQIDAAVKAVLWVFAIFISNGRLPRFDIFGGSSTEDIAIQNVQARLRMVFSYLLAQLLPWVRGKRGFLLVLGSANVDECLRGYFTKYDCSSADLNPIGSISKKDIRAFLEWAGKYYGYCSLLDIVAAVPTAELRPSESVKLIGYDERIDGGAFVFDNPKSSSGFAKKVCSAVHSDHSSVASGASCETGQADEDEMGMSYSELSVFGRLRKESRCGPYSMYIALKHAWHVERGLSSGEVAKKVKRFFTFYAINRHKMTIVTPSYHAENYSPDDNRFDLRPFLYRVDWKCQFDAIDADLFAESERFK